MKNYKTIIALILAVLCALSLVSCGTTAETTTEAPDVETTAAGTETTEAEESGLWADAVYTEDTELGEGEKTVICEVKVEDKTVTFTVKTDKDTVGAALLENNLIAGDEGPYGLYVKVVNGITADYDIDQSYWAFYIDGEMASTGVDGADIAEGVTYQLVYTK